MYQLTAHWRTGQKGTNKVPDLQGFGNLTLVLFGAVEAVRFYYRECSYVGKQYFMGSRKISNIQYSPV
jgi:hypothetical protein